MADEHEQRGRDRDREEVDDGMLEKLIAVNRVSQDRQGRPPVHLHRADRGGRRRRQGRFRLRQGARSAGRDPEVDGAGAREHDHVELNNGTLWHAVQVGPRRGARVHAAGLRRYRRDRRRRDARRARSGRRQERAGQGRRFAQSDQPGARHASSGLQANALAGAASRPSAARRSRSLRQWLRRTTTAGTVKRAPGQGPARLPGASIACRVKALGLGKINDVRELKDSPQVRGLINKVHYLVRVEE